LTTLDFARRQIQNHKIPKGDKEMSGAQINKGRLSRLSEISWMSEDKNTLVHKIEITHDHINRNSKLTVREGQAAVFAHKGRMQDVFPPGFYNLSTENLPFITALMGKVKYGTGNPFLSDIYFVNTHQFTNFKWGTTNPITLRDKDFGMVRVRGFGTYSFKVGDPFKFLTELSGAHSSFKTQEIVDYLRSMMVTSVTNAIGESKVPALDMAGNLIGLSKSVQDCIRPEFDKMGILLTKFNFESFSLPPEIEKAIDQRAAMSLKRDVMDVHMQMAGADAMRTAAGNPGAGNVMAPMMGMGMGMGMGNMMGNMMGQQMGQMGQQPMGSPMGQPGAAQSAKIACGKCGEMNNPAAKFCFKCGNGMVDTCPKCNVALKPNAKFCHGCGQSLQTSCPKCNKAVPPGTKFCPECGGKV